MFAAWSSSESVILSVVWGIFLHERVGCRPIDSIVTGDSVWSNFGTNGQDAVVLLPSEALNFLSIAVYQK